MAIGLHMATGTMCPMARHIIRPLSIWATRITRHLRPSTQPIRSIRIYHRSSII